MQFSLAINLILLQCANAVDHLASFYFRHVTTGESPTLPAALNLAQRITECPGLLPQVCYYKSLKKLSWCQGMLVILLHLLTFD